MLGQINDYGVDGDAWNYRWLRACWRNSYRTRLSEEGWIPRAD